MKSTIKFVPYGENLPEDLITPDQVARILERLEQTLRNEDLTWADVGMLWLANSRSTGSESSQSDNDQAILRAIESFADARSWHPSLIGASVFSSFFCSPNGHDADISNGLLFTAVISGVFDRIPVVHELNYEVDERPRVGRRVMGKALEAFISKASESGVDLQPTDVTLASTGLLFTTGSGHIKAEQKVDFKECYAIGQELLKAADEVDAQIVGGCATNRTEKQPQVIYFSETDGLRVRYVSTNTHAAVFTFLPYSRANLQLEHPYKRDKDVEKLHIEFDSREAYDVDRCFYVRSINGQKAIDFLEAYWPYDKEQLETMAREQTAIPAIPDAHLVTIASSLHRNDEKIWPNIPVWLEEIDGEYLLRMVRAEDRDANYYLMRLNQSALRENAVALMDIVKKGYQADASVIAFLCESRKYVLNQFGSNAEAVEMISSSPIEGCVIGTYLNGEYSTSKTRSIGYHNYSQIGAIIPRRPTTELPSGYSASRLLSDLELFACHTKSDAPAVARFMDRLQDRLRGTTVWIDEDQIKAGDNLKKKIKSVVGRGNQLVVPFLTEKSIEMDWVIQELRWALKQEKRQGRTIVLPVVIDDQGSRVVGKLKKKWKAKLADAVLDRHYVQVNDFTENETRIKAERLADDIRSRLDPKMAPDDMPDPFANL